MKPRPVKAREYGDQRIEALGQCPYIDFETDDGEMIRLWHPLRMDDAALDRYERFKRGEGLDREAVLDDNDEPVLDENGKPVKRIIVPHQINGKLCEPVTVRLMRALLGEPAHRKLLKSGITSVELLAAWEELQETPPKKS